MSLPKIVSQDEWTAARRLLLEKEKDLTRQRDRLNTERRELPMVEVTKQYEFEGPDGTLSLLDLFEGRPQLIVYHFMFHPDWDEGCPSCSAGTDELAPGLIEHLNIRDTTYALVSRAPLAKLEQWKAKKGWTIPWYSTNDGDFSYDLGATIDASRGFDEFNYRTLDEYAAMGHESMKTAEQPYDMPGLTCFLDVSGVVYRTYSVYAAWLGEHRRLLLLPRPHRTRAPRGLGAARRPYSPRPGQPAGLLVLGRAEGRRSVHHTADLAAWEVPGTFVRRRVAVARVHVDVGVACLDHLDQRRRAACPRGGRSGWPP